MGYIGSDPVRNDSVSTAQIADNAVTNPKIVDNIVFTNVTASAVSASGTITANAFSGNGTNISGVTAEWDGTHTGNGVITGNFNVTGNITGSGNISGSSTSTGSFGRLDAAGRSYFSDDVRIADGKTLLLGVNGGNVEWLSEGGTLRGAIASLGDGIQFYAGQSNTEIFSLPTSGDQLKMIGSADILWETDNSGDIGASGATRPRDLFVARNATIDGNVSGSATSTGSFGALGIGTTGPGGERKVDIRGELMVQSSGGESRHYFSGPDDDDDGQYFIYNAAAAYKIRLHAGGDSFFTGGSVGIGTTTVDENLHVYGTSNPTIKLEAPSGQRPIFHFNSGDATRANITFNQGDVIQSSIFGGKTTDQAITIQTSGSANVWKFTDSNELSGSSTSTGSFGRLFVGEGGPVDSGFHYMIHARANNTRDQHTSDAYIVSETAGSGDSEAGFRVINANAMWTMGYLYHTSDDITFTRSAGSGDLLFNGTYNVIFTGANQKISGSSTSTGSFGRVHTKPGSAGSINYGTLANMDDLIVENSNHTGITILSPADKTGHIVFGDPDDEISAQVSYDHDTEDLYISTEENNAQIIMRTGNASEALRIDSNKNVGIGTTNPDGKLHVHTATAGTWSPPAYGDDLVVENSADAGMSIVSPDGNSSYLLFGSPSRTGQYNAIVYSSYGGGSEYLAMNTYQGGEVMRLTHQSRVGIGTTSPSKLLHVEGDALVTGTLTAQEFHTEFVSASINYTSGSTKFGNSMDDEHQFTGSLQLSGSVGNESYIIGTNVGIGTTNPSEQLHVKKSSGEAKISVDGTTYSTVNFKEGGTDQWAIGYDASNNRFFINEDGVASQMVIADGGKVGIGTTSPDRRMHIHNASAGSVTAVNYTELVVEDDGGSGISILAPDANSSNVVMGFASDNDAVQLRGYYNSGNPRLAIELAASEKFQFIGNQLSGSSSSTGSFAHLDIQQTNASGLNEFIKIKSRGSSAINGIGLGSGNADLVLYADKDSATDGNIIFQVNGSEQFRITENNLISGSSSSTGSFARLELDPARLWIKKRGAFMRFESGTNYSGFEFGEPDNQTVPFLTVKGSGVNGGGIISGSAFSTGSFGHIKLRGADIGGHVTTNDITATVGSIFRVSAAAGVKLNINAGGTSSSWLEYEKNGVDQWLVGTESSETDFQWYFNPSPAGTKMRLTSAGALTVADDVTVQGDYLTITNTAQCGLKMKTDDTMVIWNYDKTSDAITGGINWNHANGTTTFHTGGTVERMRIDNSGKVGIGTNNPGGIATQSTLEIRATAAFLGLTSTAGNNSSGIEFGDTDDGNIGQIHYYHGDNTMNFNAGASSNPNFKLDTNSRISLSNNDNGTYNTIFGKNAGLSLDAGSNYNTFIGEGVSDAAMNDALYNTGVGYGAMTELTSGDYNTAIGMFAGMKFTTGHRNTFIGQAAGEQITGATSNITAVGVQAVGSGDATTAADGTVAVGRSALIALTSGISNVAIGSGSMAANQTSDYNTAVGTNALGKLTMDGYGGDTAVGYQSGLALTKGRETTAIGAYALAAEDEGDGSTAVGYAALYFQNIGGSQNAVTANTGIGAGAGDYNVTGTNNTWVGYHAGFGASGQSNSNNTGVGKDALLAVRDGGSNVAIGALALDGLTSGDSNVGIGGDALGGAVTGDFNIAIGQAAGLAVTSGHSNILIGHDAGSALTTGITTIAIGKNAGKTLSTNTNGELVIIGAGAGLSITTGYNTVCIGGGAMGESAGNAVTGNSNTVVGYLGGYELAGAASDHTLIGAAAGMNIDNTGADGTTAVGKNALLALTSGGKNVAVGFEAGAATTVGSGSVYIGYEAGEANVGDENIAIGHRALADSSADVSRVIAIGRNALASADSVNDDGTIAIGWKALQDYSSTDALNGSVAIGHEAGFNGSTGLNQAVIIGYQAGYSNNNGYNTFIGYHSGRNTTGQGNVTLGRMAGKTITSGDENIAIGINAMNGGSVVGDGNIAIGAEAGDALTSGTRNVFVGQAAGGGMQGGTDCIAIGYLALSSATSGYQDSHIAIGSHALKSQSGNVYGKNMAIGHGAMSGSTQMTNTVAIGYQALGAATDGDYNVAIGNYAMGSLGSARNPSHNVCIGFAAGRYISLAGDGNNCIVGDEAGTGNPLTGTNNTFIGTAAGSNVTSGNHNTIVGKGCIPNAADSVENLVFGRNGCQGQANGNYFTVGTSTGTDRWYLVYSAGDGWARSSDERIKKNVQSSTLGLDFIKDLRPVKFQFRSAVEMPEEVRSYHLSGEESGSLVETSDTGSINYGLIAQEVSASLSKAGVSDWTGWHENPTTSVQGLSGQSFIYPLIKAVQEMSAELSELKAQISGSNDFNTLKTAVSGSS